MIKLNSLQYPNVLPLEFDENITLHPLKNNDLVEKDIKEFSSHFGFKELKTFKFNKDGLLSLMLNLKGKITVSLGESEMIVQAALELKNRGFEIDLIPLKKDGEVNLEKIEKCDYIFCSSYVMDTYVKTNLEEVKELSEAKIIGNISATLDSSFCDIALLDSYKLTGYSIDSVVLHSGEFSEVPNSEISTISIAQIKKNIKNIKREITIKSKFLEELKNVFNENIHFFVEPSKTLDYTLHFGLKGIKAREIIRTLALDLIYVTNGEGCSLGLSKPSRILQEMGYEESQSRWVLSLDFSDDLDDETIKKCVKKIAKKYRQIMILSK